jgi:nucleoid-associated protein
MVDRRSLRRYVKFTGREKDLAISFSSSQLNSRVHYNPDKDTLSIDGIPRALREQLLRHLNQ